MHVPTGWRLMSVTALVAVPLSLVSCTAAAPAASSVRPSASPSPVPPVALSITPARGSRRLPVSTEIGTKITGGVVTRVTLVDGSGHTVTGAMRADGSSWVPDKPLAYGRSYTASVTAAGAGGTTATRTTTFTTMSRPEVRTGTGLYLFNGNTYGVAMPVVVEFNPGIPAKARAGVQRRMFVRSDPPQPGTWSWVADGRQVYYRPPQYWRPGTRLTVRIALEGVPTGGGRYGDTDRSATVTIGRELELLISNATKTMTVTRNDKVIRKLPVSLGKAGTPSSSGTMVIMDKRVQTVFDTYAEMGPVEGYRVNIAYAQRLTWGGEFIHAAPWSVADQGHRNVSHGCVNISTSNARWLFSLTKVGDPVTVTGTGHRLAPGNGWTAWNMSWAQFVKGSAGG